MGGESTDPIFLGYPYGLIAVDQGARIANEEKEFFQMQFKVTAGKDWESIASHLRSIDAHNVLDAIR